MSGKKILIVDDDRALVHGLITRLEASGYNVVSAFDTPLALFKALKEKPDLIILDIGLPGGNGFIFMERLKSLIPVAGIPVIILTDRDPQINRERVLKAGAVAFLQKPADNDELLATIRKALEESIKPVPEKQPSTIEETEKINKKILIVDDDRALVHGLITRLEASGYNVVSAFDTPLALFKALKEKPDLIILDIGLPGGNGFIFMERLKSLIPVAGIPVIILTDRDPQINRERVLKAGAVAFLQKPAENGELLTTIRKALGEGD